MHNLNKPDFSTGRPCVHVDGDITVQAEQTVLCPEVSSSNIMKSPGGTPNLGLGIPELHETQRTDQILVNSSRLVETNGRLREIAEQATTMTSLKQTKDKIWKGIGKEKGIRIATLNMNGRRDNKKKDKWKDTVTLMRQQRIAILGVQETHLNETETEIVNKANPKVIVINNGISMLRWFHFLHLD